MVARMWRGWTAEDRAAEVAADLRDGVVARYTAAPGNAAAYVLSRPIAGGVEILTLTLWATAEAVPPGVPEKHRLLVARQSVPLLWEVADAGQAIARAA